MKLAAETSPTARACQVGLASKSNAWRWRETAP